MARELALRLLRAEGASADVASEAIGAAADRVLRLLQANMSRWFGLEGFHVLLARALDRARPVHPPLAGVTLRLNGTRSAVRLLDGLFDDLKSSSPPQALDAAVAVIAALISLLGRLVGDDMAAQLVNQSASDALHTEQDFTDERTTE